jgi:hypothetical protein
VIPRPLSPPGLSLYLLNDGCSNEQTLEVRGSQAKWPGRVRQFDIEPHRLSIIVTSLPDADFSPVDRRNRQEAFSSIEIEEDVVNFRAGHDQTLYHFPPWIVPGAEHNLSECQPRDVIVADDAAIGCRKSNSKSRLYLPTTRLTDTWT